MAWVAYDRTMVVIVIGILSLILAFTSPPASLLRDPGWVMAVVAGATLIPPVVAAILARRAVERLNEQPGDPIEGQIAYGQAMFTAQCLLGGLHAGALCLTDWMKLCAGVPVIGNWPGMAGMLASGPLVISILLVWVAVYPADRAIRQIALEVHLVGGRPAHPVWPLGRFLVFNFRHQVLFILVPLGLILTARDMIHERHQRITEIFHHPFAPDLLLGAVACVVAVLAPWMLRYLWVTNPLPQGGLRDRLSQLSRRLGMRCSEILVWRSGGMIINAAVMGVIAPLRYVLITDAMLELMEDRKIEAVFGHEAGHVKQHHILYFLMFALISGCLVTVAGQLMRGYDRQMVQWMMAGLGALLLFKWWVIFGWISRAFERQADLYGTYTVALSASGADETGVRRGSVAADAARRPEVFAAAAHVFSDTLNDVAKLNNIPPEAWSWRHGSIASRSRVLQEYARDPERHAHFERRVGWMKLGIASACVASASWAVWELELWKIAAAALGIFR